MAEEFQGDPGDTLEAIGNIGSAEIDEDMAVKIGIGVVDAVSEGFAHSGWIEEKQDGSNFSKSIDLHYDTDPAVFATDLKGLEKATVSLKYATEGGEAETTPFLEVSWLDDGLMTTVDTLRGEEPVVERVQYNLDGTTTEFPAGNLTGEQAFRMQEVVNAAITVASEDAPDRKLNHPKIGDSAGKGRPKVELKEVIQTAPDTKLGPESMN